MCLWWCEDDGSFEEEGTVEEALASEEGEIEAAWVSDEEDEGPVPGRAEGADDRGGSEQRMSSAKKSGTSIMPWACRLSWGRKEEEEEEKLMKPIYNQ